MKASFFDDLNDQQKAAVTSPFDEPLFVYAGAGSGKTRTLICRIANMIMNGIDPSNILAITFTRKSADEIRERLKQFVGPRGEEVVTSTFHQLCLNILKENPSILGFSKDFKVADVPTQLKIIKNGSVQLLKGKKLTSNALRIMTSNMTNKLRRAKTLFKEPDNYEDDKDFKFVYDFYQKQLKSHCLIDFNDFLSYTEKLLKNYPIIAYQYRKIYQNILIDEFQDTSEINFNIIRLILGPDSKRITIVGDVWQSIYGFRGANPKNVATFLKCYPNAKRVVLNQNYRSTQTIVTAAQSLIANSANDVDFSSPIVSKRERGDLVKVIFAEDELSEVDQICSEIEKLVYPGSNYQYRDIVIMFRMRKISSEIEMELFRRNIPYSYKRGGRFFMRREIRELIAYARLLIAYDDDAPDPNQLISNAVETVINVPDRNIGDKQIQIIKEKALVSKLSMLTILKRIKPNEVGKIVYSRFQSFLDLIKKLHNHLCVINPNLATDEALNMIIDMANLLQEDKNVIEGSNGVDDIEELNDALNDYINDKKETYNLLLQEARRFHKQLLQLSRSETQLSTEGNLQKFINAITLEGVSESKNAVTLSTIHQMKGLESPICFIMRFNQGFLPVSEKEYDNQIEGFDSRQKLEEERRIAYVAMTRAKEKLFISLCTSYKGKSLEPSYFLSELNNTCLTNKSLTLKDKEEIKEILKFVDDDFDDITI